MVRESDRGAADNRFPKDLHAKSGRVPDQPKGRFSKIFERGITFRFKEGCHDGLAGHMVMENSSAVLLTL